MDLTLHRPGEHLFIRSASQEGVTVNDTRYIASRCLSPETGRTDWPVQSVDDLQENHLAPVLDLDPEIVILGTGATQSFPPPQLVMKFYEKGIGFEAMTTEAACRTFNVLVSEERKVVAALIIP